MLLMMAVFHTHAAAAPPLDTPAQAMAQAIARMMESMGFFAGAGDPGPIPPSGWPSAFGGVPGMSGMGHQMSPGTLMGQMGERAFGDTMTGQTTVLEGVWEDNQGGLLIVQGRFYRLYAARKGYIEGGIRVTDDRVELSNQTLGFTQTFELALDQGRLVLRDASGQLYLYRRLVLGRTP